MDPDKILDALTASETKALIAALVRRGLVAAPAMSIAGELVANLPPDTRARADAARAAMARKFDVRPEELELVVVTDDGTPHHLLVMLATSNGLKLGSWDDIFAAREAGELAIEVGDLALDPCTGMTWRAYKALIAQLAARGVHPSPDSEDVAAGNDQPWTCTLLTGERLDQGRAPFAFVSRGEPGRSWGGRDYTGGLRFRPAVVIQ
jgi:hypothetical protein